MFLVFATVVSGGSHKSTPVPFIVVPDSDPVLRCPPVCEEHSPKEVKDKT